MGQPNPESLEAEFIKHLRHHLAGLHSKVMSDFSEASFSAELASLRDDPLYSKFAFDTSEYVLIRFMGRMSISIGRRLGEIYDKLPRFTAAARYNLHPEQIAPKLNRLELDVALDYSLLTDADREYVQSTVQKYVPDRLGRTSRGIGIEIRYNFNPNDSARLRKDANMATYVQDRGWLPIYLIFSSISPREEAIARLERAGWSFLVGQDAIDFANELLSLDLVSILDKSEVHEEIKSTVDAILDEMVNSYAFQQVANRHRL